MRDLIGFCSCDAWCDWSLMMSCVRLFWLLMWSVIWLVVDDIIGEVIYVIGSWWGLSAKSYNCDGLEIDHRIFKSLQHSRKVWRLLVPELQTLITKKFFPGFLHLQYHQKSRLQDFWMTSVHLISTLTYTSDHLLTENQTKHSSLSSGQNYALLYLLFDQIIK